MLKNNTLFLVFYYREEEKKVMCEKKATYQGNRAADESLRVNILYSTR